MHKLMTQKSMTRSELLKVAGFAAGGLTLGGGLLGCTSSSSGGNSEKDSSETLTIVDPGGNYGEVLKELFYDPFAEQAGTRVQQETAGSDLWAKVEAQIQSDRVTWDIVGMGEGDLVSHRDFLENLNCQEEIPNSAQQGLEGTCEEYGVLRILNSVVVAYDVEKFRDDRPQTWADFWDVERFPGPRTMGNYAAPWMPLTAALLADGVVANDLFPMDLDRAFRKMDEIKPHVGVWWEAGEQSQQALRSGAVVMGDLWSGRALSLAEEGVPVDIDLTQALDATAFWGVLKNAPNFDAAVEFLNFYVSRPEAHTDFYERIGYPTPNKEAAQSLPGVKPENNIVLVADQLIKVENVPWVVEHRDSIIERWNTWLSQ